MNILTIYSHYNNNMNLLMLVHKYIKYLIILNHIYIINIIYNIIQFNLLNNI
jgi:hypothetical protein